MKKTILAVSAALAILSSATSCTWVRVNPKLFGEDSQNSVRGVAVEQISQADSFVVNIPVDIEYTQTEAEPFLTIEASAVDFREARVKHLFPSLTQFLLNI